MDNYWNDLPQGKEPHRTRYIKFIESRIHRAPPEHTCMEQHHMIPKAFGGIDKGIILLTTREHLIAHLMLSKCYSRSMSLAFYMMTHARGITQQLTSRQYEKVKEEAKTHSRNSHLGKVQTEKTRHKMSEAHKGSFWITNGKEDLRKMLGEEIPDGWYRGKTTNAKIHEWHSQLTEEEIREQSKRAGQRMQEKMNADPEFRAQVLTKREATRKANQEKTGMKYRSKLSKEEKSRIARENALKGSKSSS